MKQNNYGKESDLKIAKSKFLEKENTVSEYFYKKNKAINGEIMYHFHFCPIDNNDFKSQMIGLESLLNKESLILDRFGVSLNTSTWNPDCPLEKNSEGGLKFSTQDDWKLLTSFSCSQPHLGDNMIGTKNGVSNVRNALSAGVTTIGNLSQIMTSPFETPNELDEIVGYLIDSLLIMKDHVKEGVLVHTNLDDGYARAATDLGLLLGFFMLEKYLVEELIGAKLTPSYGDYFRSPIKRLAFLAALKEIYGEDLVGSMIFANKLGRNQIDKATNIAHLSISLLTDIVGQKLYKTGHAVTIMSDRGLVPNVKNEEIVMKLKIAHELENYWEDYLKLFDFVAIEHLKESIVKRGMLFFEYGIEQLKHQTDISSPSNYAYSFKTFGAGHLVDNFEKNTDEMLETDFSVYNNK
ncbi:MAG: hypothetical protein Q4G61_09850 [Tissierellia bacterium]|nr:hypothetical protein [Tissierellia bacterium]